MMIHPDDAAPLGIAEGSAVELSNRRGAVRLHAKLFDGLRRGVLVAESIWPNGAHADGRGINTLTGADAPISDMSQASYMAQVRDRNRQDLLHKYGWKYELRPVVGDVESRAGSQSHY